jgi:hypothetical protein
MPSETSLDKPAIVLAAAATGTAAVLVFALLPVIAGTMADHYQLVIEPEISRWIVNHGIDFLLQCFAAFFVTQALILQRH